MQDREVLIQTHDVSVTFGEQQVLRNIDLEFHRGETVAIIGESGCGKTVLLKTLISLIKPTTGWVEFDGDDLAKLSDYDLTAARKRIGFVFQNAALFDSMTVGQNVAFPLKQAGDTSGNVRQTVEQRLHEVGLPASVVSKKPVELSGGMRKRVGLARALIIGPELVLYDEPTTGLDPIMSDVINELIIGTRDRHNVTSIMVTHDMHSAKKVADRIVMVYPLSRLRPDEPQVLYDGPPEEIDQFDDLRVRQFVRGEAGDRLSEMMQQQM